MQTTTAAAWDALWTAFTAARRAGDAGGALRAARRMVLWQRVRRWLARLSDPLDPPETDP